MIEFFDSHPDIDVAPAEYMRLLGFPRGHKLQGRAWELAAWAQTWYAQNARPWIFARQADAMELSGDCLTIEGIRFSGQPLVQSLAAAGADGVVLVAVSAGPEGENEARRAWLEGRPDEYYFLETYGSALVEHLLTMTGVRLCDWAEQNQMAVLPHYSPGYPEWSVAEQGKLVELVKQKSDVQLQRQLDALDSGMLVPKKSQVAVFGLTHQSQRVARISELSPCEHCSFAPCRYRRASYKGSSRFSRSETAGADPPVAQTTPIQPLITDARYAVNAKALRKWAQDRLSLQHRDDGSIDAQFHYDGTTCTNMGRALTFQYDVRLGPRDTGYVIQDQTCQPAPGDQGHRHMCQFLEDGDRLLAEIAGDRPLLGARLDDVLHWERPTSSAACYCDARGRMHKWGLVLETLHFALAEREVRLNSTVAPEHPTL